MNWSRWSAFFCLCGLTAFVPAVFVPAMLVANAVDGPRWYSVWSGIREFFRGGQTFLAVLICCFSLVFPLVKFTLGLLCSAGERWLPHRWRRGIVMVTSWSAKYSMLDVMVIAMLIMLVKVNEYVRVLPSLGLYLFSAAILLSALAGAALNRALAAELKLSAHTAAEDALSGQSPAHIVHPSPSESSVRFRRAWLPWLLALALGAAMTGWGGTLLRHDSGGTVQSVELTRLTNRGDLRRSVEKAIALKELASDDHKLFSRDTLRRFMELGQAVTTDAGWKEPEVRVVLDTANGSSVTSEPIKGVNLDDPSLKLHFPLTEKVTRAEIAAVRLISNIELAKFIRAPIEEEHISAEGDPFRKWTRTWHGRIFSFELSGAPDPGLRAAVVLTLTGVVFSLWAIAALLTPCAPGSSRRIAGISPGSRDMEAAGAGNGPLHEKGRCPVCGHRPVEVD